MDERDELLQLRLDIKKYRDLEAAANEHHEDHDLDNHSVHSQESVFYLFNFK